MKIFSNKQTQFNKLTGTLRKWRWAILIVIGVSLLWFEIREFSNLEISNQEFHYLEATQYAIMLITMGILIESYARSNAAYKRTIKILEYKHELKLELSSIDDQESLLEKLAQIPGRFASAEEAYILMKDVSSDDWDVAGHWSKTNDDHRSMFWNPSAPCPVCLKKIDGKSGLLHMCVYDETFPFKAYSLPLTYRGVPITIIKFRLSMGASLTLDEMELFNNIGDEIVTALQASQDRKNLIEMQAAEAAMAERRIVSAFVHDQLGQNLGYLHLKLDQLGDGAKNNDPEKFHSDILHLRDVANESYEIVRNILKKIQPETVPHLTNLLLEQSRTVSQRAKFKLDFKTTGRPVPVVPDVQQPIFFTFCEILNNIEKHAHADKVEVLVMWSPEMLDVSIADNGIGFDLQAAHREGHFGLEIMYERVEKLKGQILIDTREGKGTIVSMSIPLATNSVVPA